MEDPGECKPDVETQRYGQEGEVHTHCEKKPCEEDAVDDVRGGTDRGGVHPSQENNLHVHVDDAAEEAIQFEAEDGGNDEAKDLDVDASTVSNLEPGDEDVGMKEPTEGDSGADDTFGSDEEENEQARHPSVQRQEKLVNGGTKTKSAEEDVPAGLPVTRVKRIIKLDPDIKLVSKEGLFAIIHTTQLFLESLAAESISQAWKCKRKGVKVDDLVVAAKSNSKFRDCLGTSLSDFVASLGNGDEIVGGGSEEEPNKKSTASMKGNMRKEKKNNLPPPNNRSITDFF